MVEIEQARIFSLKDECPSVTSYDLRGPHMQTGAFLLSHGRGRTVLYGRFSDR